jgi:hypothetical protein
MYRIEKRDARLWAVIDPSGELVCLCAYLRGAKEVVRRLTGEEPERRYRLA